MNRHEAIPVITVTLCLLAFVIAILTESLRTAQYIFTLSPFLICWMVYSVIRFGKYKGRELIKDEEWGYADKSKDELKTF